MATTNSFAKRLFEARLAYSIRMGRQYTQSELAHKVGVTPQSWSAWEGGKSEPPLDTISKLARILGVNAGLLAFGDEERPVSRPIERKGKRA